MRHHFCRSALGDNMPTVHTRARADVDHVVRKTNGIFIVLNHDHRITDVPKVLQRTQQAIVVPLMQANGRLIEDVQHTDQAGANLAGQANPLGLTTGKRIGTAVQ